MVDAAKEMDVVAAELFRHTQDVRARVLRSGEIEGSEADREDGETDRHIDAEALGVVDSGEEEGRVDDGAGGSWSAGFGGGYRRGALGRGGLGGEILTI